MHYCPGSAAPSLNSHDDVPWSSLEVRLKSRKMNLSRENFSHFKQSFFEPWPVNPETFQF